MIKFVLWLSERPQRHPENSELLASPGCSHGFFLNHVTPGTGDKNNSKQGWETESYWSLKYKYPRWVQTRAIISKRSTQGVGSAALCAGWLISIETAQEKRVSLLWKSAVGMYKELWVTALKEKRGRNEKFPVCCCEKGMVAVEEEIQPLLLMLY